MEKTKAHPRMKTQEERLKKRLEEDRKIQEHLEEVRQAEIAAEVARWNENAMLTAEFNRLRNHNTEVQKEVKLGSQTLTMVRREQLRKLYEEEEEQYITELNAKGLALFKERI